MIKVERVTIIVLTFNRKDELFITLNTLEKQDYPNFDILIVDSGSDDGTDLIDFSKYSCSIIYKKFQENLGFYKNLIRAISLVDTDLFSVFHSDDLYFSNIISSQVKVMNESSSGAVFTSMINMNSDLKSFLDLTKLTNSEEIRYENDEYSTFIIKLLERGIFYYCPTFMSRKSVIIEAGLFDQSDFISDLSIWIPIIKKFSISNILNDFAFYSNSTKQLIYSLQQNRMSPSPEFKVLDTLIMNENIPFNYSLLRYNYRKFNDTLYILFNSFRRKNIIKILYNSFRAIKIIITYFSLRLILNLTKCNHH